MVAFTFMEFRNGIVLLKSGLKIFGEIHFIKESF